MAESEIQPPNDQSATTPPPLDATHSERTVPADMAALPPSTPPPEAEPERNNGYDDKTPLWKKTLEFSALGLALLVAVIYGGQLWVMNKQLGEMKGSGEQTDRLLCLYQQQLAQITKQATDTHDLAVAAGKQADQALTQTTQTTKLATDTHELASSAVIQSRATRDLAGDAAGQLATMKTQLEISQRAWIAVDAVSLGHFEWVMVPGRPLQAVIEPTIDYRNVGNIPAVNVYGVTEVVFADQTGTVDFKPYIIKEQREFCSKSMNSELYATNPKIVFPSKGSSFGVSANITPRQNQIRQRDGLISPVVVGCVYYEFSTSSIVHHTGFIYTLETKDQSPLVYGKPVDLITVNFLDAWNGVASIN
jgi:hypothetical protein